MQNLTWTTQCYCCTVPNNSTLHTHVVHLIVNTVIKRSINHTGWKLKIHKEKKKVKIEGSHLLHWLLACTSPLPPYITIHHHHHYPHHHNNNQHLLLLATVVFVNGCNELRDGTIVLRLPARGDTHCEGYEWGQICFLHAVYGLEVWVMFDSCNLFEMNELHW